MDERLCEACGAPLIRKVGEHGPVHGAPELLAVMREHTPGSDQERTALAGQDAEGRQLRDVWRSGGSSRPSRRPESVEQRPDELDDALFVLSPETALAGGSVETDGWGSQGAGDCGCSVWGIYAPAVHRWEMVLNRVAPAPTVPNSKGALRLSARAVEWMLGLPDGWVTGVDIPRNAQLKALGNGVCPQQCAAAVRSLVAA